MKKKKISLLLAVIMCVSNLLVGIGPLNNVTKYVDSVFDGYIVLGRPTNNTMTASITSKTDREIYLSWGEETGVYTQKSSMFTSTEKEPAVITMKNLLPDKTYYYRLFFRNVGEKEYVSTEEYSFNTPKSEGNEFNFVVQGDSHLLNKADKDLYRESMENIAGFNPDFMVDMGDTFLNDNTINSATQSYETVAQTYRQQLEYFDIVTKRAPLFLTIGNHEGEYKNFLDGTMDNIAAKSTLARTTYYPNPIPNKFYTGNTTTEELFGYVQNYYSYQWGDALFVSIDPYRYSDVNPYSQDGQSSGWNWTLGEEQYKWFRETLENSDAKYKFVFSHHAVGNMRGGKEIASLYEWGGHDKKGRYLFDEYRPGWGKPIQQIMKDTGVTIFFQGHDHLFAREDVDGVVYQTIPKPAEKVADRQNNFKAFKDADLLMNSGFLNVDVKNDKVQVDYFRNYIVSSDPQEGNTGIVYSYTVDKNGNVEVLKNTEDNLDNYGKNEESSGNDVEIGVGANPKDSMMEVPEDGYSFAIQADPHLDENTSENLYKQTLLNIKDASPSFLLDLGDTSMVEKLSTTQEDVTNRYTTMRGLFDLIGDIPLYLANGNHDGENGFNKVSSEMADWARDARHKYFPFPENTDNVTGNTETANYYSFTKDNAQFIILDPYTYSTEKVGKNNDGWASTLGKTQYDWLKETLEKSKSKFKFVFIHNLAGGVGNDQRGGAEAAEFFEWGGYNANGIYEFDTKREGWGKPIHDLLVENNVDVVFHGHDHFYAKQQKDDIIYQLVPQPGTPGNSVYDAYSYSYREGTFLPSAGYLRVVVEKGKANVEYISIDTKGNISIKDSYTITNK